ncbi:hypothetical protein Bbelb_261560 [Branchiostoma belcheri]|nr:hypothetical protein Bbelb_261560 [Branchiostoma belcheri]
MHVATKTARRLCRKFPGWFRVLFFLVTILALGFLVNSYWHIKGGAEKRLSGEGDKKFAERELRAKTTVPEIRLGDEVHGASKEREYALAKEAEAKLDIAKRHPEEPQTFKSLLATEKCPACFGESLCEQADAGVITVDVTNKELEHKGVYFGRFKDTDIVAKRLAGTSAWTQLDRFICHNASLPNGCDVSKVISTTILVTDDALQLSWLRDAWRIAHTDRQIALETCITAKLIEELKKVYDQNLDGQLSKTERAYMITSLLMNPEAAVLNYLTTRSERNWPFPQYLGACGRVIFVENGGKLLDASLGSPWKVKANLALQLLDMIDAFRNGDPDWIVMFLDFRFENFAVDRNGRLNLIDFDEVVLVDRNESSGVDEKKEPFNFEDFKEFLSVIEKGGLCLHVSRYSDVMYALACVRLLSYLPEHRTKLNPNKLVHNKQRPLEGAVRPPGLLWGPPEHEAKALEPLLRGCVVENVAGGRLNAVEGLKAILRRNVKG